MTSDGRVLALGAVAGLALVGLGRDGGAANAVRIPEGVTIKVDQQANDTIYVEAYYDGKHIGGLEALGARSEDHPGWPSRIDFRKSCGRAINRLSARSGRKLGAWMVLESEIHRAWRGQGVGLAIYEAALDAASKAGCALVPHYCLYDDENAGSTSDMADATWHRLAKLPGVLVEVRGYSVVAAYRHPPAGSAAREYGSVSIPHGVTISKSTSSPEALVLEASYLGQYIGGLETWSGVNGAFTERGDPADGWKNRPDFRKSCARSLAALSRRVGKDLGAWMVLESGISPKWHGRGVGLALYDRALTEASLRGCALVPNRCLYEEDGGGATSDAASATWDRLASLPGVVVVRARGYHEGRVVAAYRSPAGSAARVPYPGPTLPSPATPRQVADAYLALRAAVPDMLQLRCLLAVAEADLDGKPHPRTPPQVYFRDAKSFARQLADGKFPAWADLLRVMPAAWPASQRLYADAKKGEAKVAAREAADATWEAQAIIVDPDDVPPARALRGKDVWLYHGTSSVFLPRILREGLVPGDVPVRRKRLRRSNAGGDARYQSHVFLTARDSGSASSAEWYARGAAATHGGHPVILRVVVPFDDLSPDPDDADIASGRYQWVVDHVPLEAIREVDGKRRVLRGSRALPAPTVALQRVGPTDVRSQFFPGVGMSSVRTGTARAVVRKASQEFAMVLKSVSKDRTLTVDTSYAEDFLVQHGISLGVPALYIDLVRVNRKARGAGNGRDMVERVFANAPDARVAFLVAKQFTGEASPVAFWMKRGFVALVDGADLVHVGAGELSSRRVVPRETVVLMAKIV